MALVSRGFLLSNKTCHREQVLCSFFKKKKKVYYDAVCLIFIVILGSYVSQNFNLDNPGRVLTGPEKISMVTKAMKKMTIKWSIHDLLPNSGPTPLLYYNFSPLGQSSALASVSSPLWWIHLDTKRVLKTFNLSSVDLPPWDMNKDRDWINTRA